jgi:hypothetical protein
MINQKVFFLKLLKLNKMIVIWQIKMFGNLLKINYNLKIGNIMKIIKKYFLYINMYIFFFLKIFLYYKNIL